MTTTYTTETNGPGDLTAQRRHNHEVRRMMLAALRRPCPVHKSMACGDDGMGCDSGLGSV